MTDEVLDRMLADFAGVLTPFPSFAIFDLRAHMTVASVGGDVEPPIDAADFLPAQFLVVADGVSASFDADTMSSVAVEAATLLQEFVMDTRGHGWPELSVDGEFRDILFPALDEWSRAVWRGSRGEDIPFGSLATREIVPVSQASDGF